MSDAETNAAREGHKELRDRDEEEDCLAAMEPLGVGSVERVCEMTKGLVFLWWLNQKRMEGKGDYRGEEAGAGWAMLGTLFVE